MTHSHAHPQAGKTVHIKKHVTYPDIPGFGGAAFDLEDWWDRIGGKSWMYCDGNPACMLYAIRSGLAPHDVATDDEVVYGKLNGLGYLLHVSEIE